MLKNPTSTEIEAIKLVMRAYDDKREDIVTLRENLITLQAKRFSLNELFIEEFETYITKETFSNSKSLEYTIIKKYSHLFDFEIWLKNNEKSLAPLLYEEFITTYGIDSTVLNLIINATSPEYFTEEIINKYFSNLELEAKRKLLNSSPLIANPNFLIENSETLTVDIFKNKRAKISWTNNLLEQIFTSKKTLTVRFLIMGLYQSKDLAFIRRMLNTPFNYINSGETFDVDLKNVILKFSENYMGELFDVIRNYNKNALTYEVMSFLLKMKDHLDENFLMENTELFMNNGLSGELAKYARQREYKSLMILLRLA